MQVIKECTLGNGKRVYYRSKADVDVLSRELFEDPIYLRHGLTLHDGAVVIDVGANIGFFLLGLAQRLKHASVYCFEPLRDTFEVLERNAADLGGLTTRLFNCGLSKSSGTAVFTYFPRMSVASTMYPDHSAEFRRDSRRFVLEELKYRSAGWRAVLATTPEWVWFPLTELVRRHYQKTREVTCELKRLSDVIADEEIECIDLLKVDTERAEVDVLNGIDSFHWNRIRQVIVEVHEGRPVVDQVVQLLEEHGFITVSEPTVPGLDQLFMIYARRPAAAEEVADACDETSFRRKTAAK
jgi:FkbM family methyltransferase